MGQGARLHLWVRRKAGSGVAGNRLFVPATDGYFSLWCTEGARARLKARVA